MPPHLTECLAFAEEVAVFRIDIIVESSLDDLHVMVVVKVCSESL